MERKFFVSRCDNLLKNIPAALGRLQVEEHLEADDEVGVLQRSKIKDQN